MEVGNADRSVSDAHMQAFMLMRIDYPTGGYSEFEYEPHQFTDRYPQSTGAFATMPAPLNKGGGLRVKKITEKADAAAPARITQYKYGENENGLARVQVVPTLDTFVDELWYFQRIPTPNCQLSFNFQTYRNLSINGLSDYSKYLIGTTPIWYEEVSEYVNEEKTTYKYQYMEDLITHLLSFKLITRPFVFSYQGLFQEGPQLTERIAYRKSGSSYLPVERHKRYYDWMNVSPYQVNSTIIDRKIVLQSFEPFEPGADLYADFFLYTHYGVNINEIDYHRIPYSIRPSYYRMNREETIRYPEVGVPFAQEVSYAYVEDYSTRLRQSSRSSSDAARDIRTYLTYSTDYGDAIHVAMQNKHMVGMPIEQQTYNGSLETRRVRTNYTNSAPITTGLILPGSIQTSTTGASGLENELVFNAYDNRGNPLQATPRKAPAESYLWDYQGQQVVASVTNAVRTDIAYASFEAEGKGNWSYSGATIADATAPTGRRAYNLSGGSLSKTGLNSSVTYLLSYWAKSASAGSISGGAATAVRNHNGWTQYVREFSGLTSLTLSGSALIDEVRLHPKVALMTSFTFDPLVGMTSQTDASGRIVYYYYDSYRRLQAIRDLNGNLVQSFCYNIKGEPIDCSTPLPY